MQLTANADDDVPLADDDDVRGSLMPAVLWSVCSFQFNMLFKSAFFFRFCRQTEADQLKSYVYII